MDGQGQKPGGDNETILSLSDSGRAFTGEDELAAGTKIGKYVVKRLLGRGGMGAVYEAIDSVLQRDVALKILPRSLTEDEQALRRFIREAQLAAKLNHPNVVTVYDVGRKAATYFIAMELVRGRSSEEYLQKKGSLSWRDATRLVAGACRALVAAHRAGLIHRDIKPANILCADDGMVKLSDFGLAKLHVASNATLTQKDVVLGTPKYMSPEQCQNETVDARSDIYSLGATYYALLTGTAPYDTGTTMQILFAHCSRPVPDPRTLAAHLPEACTQIIHKAMAKSPGDRYASADDMLKDLQRLLSPAPTGATAATRPDPTSPALADLITALGDRQDPAASSGSRSAPALHMADLSPAPSRAPLLAGAAAVLVVLVVGAVAWLALRPNGTSTPTAVAGIGAATQAPAPIALPVVESPTPQAPPAVTPVAELTPAPVQQTEPPVVAVPPPASVVTPPPSAAVVDLPVPEAPTERVEAPPEPVVEAGPPPEPPPVPVDDAAERFERLRETLMAAAQSRSPQDMRAAVRAMEDFHHEQMRASDSEGRQWAVRAREVLEQYKPPGPGQRGEDSDRRPPERREPPSRGEGETRRPPAGR